MAHLEAAGVTEKGKYDGSSSTQARIPTDRISDFLHVESRQYRTALTVRTAVLTGYEFTMQTPSDLRMLLLNRTCNRLCLQILHQFLFS